MSYRGHVFNTVAMLAIASPAAAHKLAASKRVRLAVSREKTELTVRVAIDPHGHGEALLDRYDADRNGTLDEDEREAAGGFVARRAERDVRLLVDGEVATLRRTATDSSGLRSTRSDHSEVVFVLEAKGKGKMPHAIDLTDRPAEGGDEVAVSGSASGGRFRTVSGGILAEDGAQLDGAVLHTGETLHLEIE